MTLLPQALRSRTPHSLRDDARLRALSLALGLIPPRSMHSEEDLAVLLEAVDGARRVVEIGVYEGGSALVLLRALEPQAELHLIDPFGRHPDALPAGWGASERATRAVLGRARRRLGGTAPRVHLHTATSHEVAGGWTAPLDAVFIDGDHSEEGCERDWRDWRRFVRVGGHVVFHDARAGRPGGRGLPGPTAVVERLCAVAGWEVAAERDRTVALRRLA